MSTKKHLTNVERSAIEHMLRGGDTIGEIAKSLGKSGSTISREIKKHRQDSNKSAYGRIVNRCVNRKDCTKVNVCGESLFCLKATKCRSCRLCNQKCADYVEEKCRLLDKPPYVCNGCKKERECTLRKKYYCHNKAQLEYKGMLTESRSGINISEVEVEKMNDFMVPLIKMGQSVNHIMASQPDQFSICQKTMYKYIRNKVINVHRWDLPRMVRMRPRANKSIEHKIDLNCRVGRTYADYQAYIKENPDIAVVEMDSVIGKVGGKVLLTLLFTNCSLMLAFIRERNTSQSVIDIFNMLYEKLGHERFVALFSASLTDNGSEFSNPVALETVPEFLRNTPEPLQRTKIFYCDPYASYQKGRVEVCHELIRRFLPKGSSFDDLLQSDIDLMMSHINSYRRKKLNNNSPIDAFSFLYDPDILNLLNIRRIDDDEIIISPSLLKK